jgi:hypothetical protein
VVAQGNKGFGALCPSCLELKTALLKTYLPQTYHLTQPGKSNKSKATIAAKIDVWSQSWVVVREAYTSSSIARLRLVDSKATTHPLYTIKTSKKLMLLQLFLFISTLTNP